MSAPGCADGWVRACRLADLDEDEPVQVDIGSCLVCLVRAYGAVYALRDECTHQAVPLSEGEVTGGAIECWLHGSRFELATGRVLSPPATQPVAVFPVRIDGGDVFVHLDDPGRAGGIARLASGAGCGLLGGDRVAVAWMGISQDQGPKDREAGMG